MPPPLFRDDCEYILKKTPAPVCLANAPLPLCVPLTVPRPHLFALDRHREARRSPHDIAMQRGNLL
jgi:hypothetical protein